MALIVQLSDLHLFADPDEQPALFSGLVAALERDRLRRGRAADLLVITGDVFDSAGLEAEPASDAFAELHARVVAALGGPPTVVVPGNHDRRRSGLLGPHSGRLFDTLAKRLADTAWVHGTDTPFLSALVPHELHGLPLWIVAYDTTYLPHGWISAGGALQQEDLLYAAAQIGGREPDWPIVFLLHHHLVPTPVTDLGPIELEGTHPVLRWGVERLLPKLVANADREELTMTALGAGTALSTLHTLGRAVLVLHGHKHYATARLLDGVHQGDGDVLLVSAGSAGKAERWYPTMAPDAARLWPSFNVLDWSGDTLSVETVSFGWKEHALARHAERPLVCARREGAQWKLEHVPLVVPEHQPGLVQNEAAFDLAPSSDLERWDYRCARRVETHPDSQLESYVETVDALPGARARNGAHADQPLPVELSLVLDGTTNFLVERAVARDMSAVRALYGDRASPFAWLGLMNRYHSEQARLTVRGLGVAGADAFASATDLGTGLERPLSVERDGDVLRIVYDACPARTLLRLYWRLRR